MDEVIQLIVDVRNNSNNAFETLCDKYKALIDSMAKKYSDMYPKDINASSIKEDFSQEAKLAFYNACLKYDIENNKVTFGAFAKTCIKNRLISCLRRAGSKKRQKRPDNEIVTESIQDKVIKRETEKKLLSLAEKKLSKYELRIFKMYVQGIKIKEISEKVGKDIKSVNNAIFRIRTKLKKLNTDT